MQWLKERFASVQEIFEESWAYREMVEKGITQGITIGREEGLKEGEEKGHLEEARHGLIEVVSERFPALVSFAEQQASLVNDLATLRGALKALLNASTEEQARQVLAQIIQK